MFTIFGVPSTLLFSQLLLGLINGSFYALLSLGLAVIFGLLNISNFAHGALFMLGAFCAWFLSTAFGIGYWPALILAPLLVGAFGWAFERTMLRRIYKLDHLYGILLTFGLALVLEGAFREMFGATGQPYAIPAAFQGGINLGFMYLPLYRGWVIVASVLICVATWLAIEKTRLGSYLRAATENAPLVSAFGINVPRLISLTYAGGVALAALAGVMAAPIYQVNPLMGSNLIIIVFAVVVIGGMGSIAGAVITGFGLGLVEALTKVYFPPAATTAIFIIMAIVLMWKPAGLFGVDRPPQGGTSLADTGAASGERHTPVLLMALLAILLVAPFAVYPGFLMKALCFALFASAFNLLAGHLGLVSFGHAAFFGASSYVAAHAAKVWGFTPELAMLAGAAAAAILGILFGALAVRRQGIYFAMVTLALAQMVYFLAVQAPFTGGEDGIQDVPRELLFGLFRIDDPFALYAFVLCVTSAGIAVVYRAINSPFGQVLQGIRDNEARMVSLGYRTERYKLAAFVLSATLCGLAGGTKAMAFQVASLTDVHWAMSGTVVLMVLLGGIGTTLGPIVGAFLLVAIELYLAQLGSWVTIIEGAIFMVCVLMLRRGVVGEAQRLVASIWTRAHGSAAASVARLRRV